MLRLLLLAALMPAVMLASAQAVVDRDGEDSNSRTAVVPATLNDPVRTPLAEQFRSDDGGWTVRDGVSIQGQRKQSAQAGPTSYTAKNVEGWTVRVDDRLLKAPDDELGTRALRFLEAKLSEIKVVVPQDKVKKLQKVTIVLDLNNGNLGVMQYHPSAEWLKSNGYSADLAKCVHLPRAAEVMTKRNINEQPWVILHELAHAYHDQELGFDEPRIMEAYQKYKQSGRGEKTLLFNGKRVKHYALTNQKEFFAEMTESYLGVNDFFPFNRGELKESEPAIYEVMAYIWDSPPAKPK